MQECCSTCFVSINAYWLSLTQVFSAIILIIQLDHIIETLGHEFVSKQKHLAL